MLLLGRESSKNYIASALQALNAAFSLLFPELLNSALPSGERGISGRHSRYLGKCMRFPESSPEQTGA
jgi:hypothetical protein